ncbi:DNAL4 protein, partial [Probosciger aterrimus]|nr:DNAL4 protein [Probosciger aterrimus]
MADTGEGKKEEAEYKRLHTFPLIRLGDVCLKSHCLLCLTLCSPYHSPECCQDDQRNLMDKKFGSSWHVVIGEGFGFEITHEVKNLLYMFFGGSLAVCVWKCS